MCPKYGFLCLISGGSRSVNTNSQPGSPVPAVMRRSTSGTCRYLPTVSSYAVTGAYYCGTDLAYGAATRCGHFNSSGPRAILA
eukprot:3338795-Rhodomonas_salina.3